LSLPNRASAPPERLAGELTIGRSSSGTVGDFFSFPRLAHTRVHLFHVNHRDTRRKMDAVHRKKKRFPLDRHLCPPWTKSHGFEPDRRSSRARGALRCRHVVGQGLAHI
jgi:hypothetical protein